ncbi:DUF6144 family protein [Agathobaculum sp. NTUH-O15-33]|uniref:DUF6144 family protein n=1 Tax=Agathobaculum sp. NTUH-O15-33 TaxID=3079302 RepID=UPI002958B9FA|nr:DUF6144 family protein [Agathobaculum sp. NTUH-O15-33]WNX86553.1 DUF6144 family protein [Agathobaculum sp. NTUH-O15-33]
MFDIRKMQESMIYEAVRAESDMDTAKKVVYGDYDESKTEDNADWVKSTMSRLEDKFDFDSMKRIRMNCQCGYGMDEKLELLKELMGSATSMEELAKSDKAKSAGLLYKDGDLYLQFWFCPCPMVAEVEKLETSSWCQCTTGYSKVLFEKAFGCEVDVELLKSIKTGADSCLMKIIPHRSIW